MLVVDCEFGFDHSIGTVSSSFEPGKIYGFCGPNGSGKTTLARTVAGEIHPYSGSVTLDGQPTSDGNLVGRLAYISRPEFYPDLSVGEHIKLLEKYSKQDFSAAIEQWALAELLDSPPSRLSSGQQQRVYLGTQLLMHRDVTIVDEPERHLDQDWVDVCCAQLRGIADRGSMVLVATHSQAVRSCCDEILSIGA